MILFHTTEKKHAFFPVILGFVILLAALLILIFAKESRDDERRLIVNEFMANNRFVLEDEDGDYPDWIEMYNPTGSPVNLEGYWLSDDPSGAFKWTFPEKLIEPGEYLIIFASGKDRTDPDGKYLHTNFRINRTGESIVLGHSDGKILDTVTFGETLPSNISYGRISTAGNAWAFFLDATPGGPNDTQFHEELPDLPELKEDFPVYINEFLSSNRRSLMDEDGDQPQWIEFHNSSEKPVNLKDFWLSDKKSNPYKWRFPEVLIQPGQYLVVFASGKNRLDPEGEYLHTDFRLNDKDDELVFKTPEGKVIDLIPVRNQYADVSYGRDLGVSDSWVYFSHPTPGETNYTQGANSLAGFTPLEIGKLHINEVMAENLITIADEDGEYSSWIEIYNSSQQPIDLKGFGLSDNEGEPFRWMFPEMAIEAGEYIVVFASRKDRRIPEENLHTNYQIKGTGETILLTHPSGIIIDQLSTGKLTPDVSIGRYPDGSSNSRYLFLIPLRKKTTLPKNILGMPTPLLYLTWAVFTMAP
jgi:hypothetical protein